VIDSPPSLFASLTPEEKRELAAKIMATLASDQAKVIDHDKSDTSAFKAEEQSR
jgi:hypothetical protein